MLLNMTELNDFDLQNLRWSIFLKIHFCVDSMFAAAKYVFLACIVPVVEIEGPAAMLKMLNLTNQCDLQFLTIK